MATAKSPKGLLIGGGNRKPSWKVGKQIGAGACGAVFEVTIENGKDSGFVAKIVEIPTKATKKGNSPAENNARLLHHESVVYCCQFPDFQGTILPKLPPMIGPPVTGDTGGFRFLILEKMQGGFFETVVPALVKKSAGAAKIPVGSIPQRLVQIVKAFHEKGRVLIDVKPENFMIAFTESKKRSSTVARKGKSDDVTETLSSKLRVLDLGLVQEWRAGKHRPDEGIKNMIGTPMYASLNVHDLHTPSRRDDLEAVGYIVAELVIRIVAKFNGETAKYEKKDMPSYLPWSHEPSDEAICQVKRDQVETLNSDFYKRMGDKSTAKAVFSYLKEVRNLGYNQTPDYDSLENILAGLTVIQGDQKKPTKKSKADKGQSPARVLKRAAASRRKDESDDDDESQNKIQKVIVIDDDDDGFYDAVEGSPEEMDVDLQPGNGFEDAGESMDWELAIDENQENIPSRRRSTRKIAPKINQQSRILSANSGTPTSKKSAKKLAPMAKPSATTRSNVRSSKEETKARGGLKGLQLQIFAGPHKGDIYELLPGISETFNIGTTSSTAKKGIPVVLAKDTSLASTHARVTLVASKKLSKVVVTDLAKSVSSGTTVNGKLIPPGKEQVAFINDKIQMGDSLFLVAATQESE